MRLSIVTFDGFNEIDAFLALSILNQMRGEGWRADIVCAGPKITSNHSVVVASQRPLEWANDSDVVLFGSSQRMRDVAADPKVLRRLSLDPEQQLLGAQCNGSLMLQAMGALPDPQVCAEQPSLAWLIQAGLKPILAPFRAIGNVATAGGRLSASYLAAWVIWRLDSAEAARHALYRVAPAGEENTFIDHVLDVVRPHIDGSAEAISTPTLIEEAPNPILEPPAPILIPTYAAPSEPPPRPAPVALKPIIGFRGRDEALFSGIVQATGKIATVQPLAGDILRVMVVSEYIDFAAVPVGSSLAVNGVRVDVVATTAHSVKYDMPAALIDQVAGLDEPGNDVNLERPLLPGQRVGGHLVSGQVDAIGEVRKFAPIGESWELVVQVEKRLAPCIAVKGSITLNGVALTVNQVKDVQDRCVFTVNLIPHTVAVTALKRLQIGRKVNVEVDALAQDLLQMLEGAHTTRPGKHPKTTPNT